MLCYVRSTYETHMSVKEISHMPGISNTFSCLRRHWRFKETLSDWEPAPLITTEKKVVETHWKPKCIHFSSNPNDLQKKKKKTIQVCHTPYPNPNFRAVISFYISSVTCHDVILNMMAWNKCHLPCMHQLIYREDCRVSSFYW